MKSQPTRKRNRLPQYDYSSVGAYFLTLCTEGKKCLLSTVSVGETSGLPPAPVLTEIGSITDTAIRNISAFYSTVRVDCFVIMPNHVHILLQIQADKNGRPMVSPTIDRVVKQLKGVITKEVGRSVWQKSYYDHVIRNQRDYEETARYIYENPLRWQTDKLYVAN